MSRARTRPTRDDTRQRLFEAAARVFEGQGIGAASIDAIASEAGFSRGAFYSNFATKDDLIIAMLEDHARRSAAYHREMLARRLSPQDLVAVLRADERSPQDPLGRSPLLHTELVLFVARSGTRRTELAEHLNAGRAMFEEAVAQIYRGGGIDPVWAGAMLLALQDGYRLHRLIDPETTPMDSFFSSMAELQRLLGLTPGEPV